MLATDRLPISEPRVAYGAPDEATPALLVIDRPDLDPLPLAQGQTLLGKGGDAHLSLDDRFVSRRHARVVRTRGGLLIEDLGSTNGTRLRERPVMRARLAPGDVFAVGRARLAVVSRYPGRTPLWEFGDWTGAGPAALGRLRALLAAATLDVPVLISGPTGAGKEVAASLLHAGGPRREHALVPLNCATLEPALADAELFGHCPGAFTDARADRAGAFLAAGRGTLFLDEIAEVAPAVQAKLLRVLERREVRRLGEDAATPIACRVVAATHADLRELVRRNSFRADLLHRLSGVLVSIPALDERPEDVSALARQHARRARYELRPQAEALLARQRWPGNARQLLHTLVRARLSASGGPVDAAHVALAISQGETPGSGQVHIDHPRFEDLLEQARASRGSLRKALVTLGIPRSTYYDWRARRAREQKG